jgi:FkbM family methyltransferase
MNRIRNFAKRQLKHSPILYQSAQWAYHELIYSYSRAKLRLRYPDLKIVRYSEAELDLQRLAGYQSQFGQDYFISTELFANFRCGVFLDIGCNQPEYLNNTYFFEKKNGWTGLAFDPIARYAGAWSAERSAAFLAVALGASDGEKEFVEIDNCEGWTNMMSAFADKARPEDLQMGYKSYSVTVRCVSNLLDQYNIAKVDFASIDVEGAELDVLSGFDLEKHGPKVLLIENRKGFTGDQHLRDYLTARGYRLYARIWTCDDVFVKV